jgi:hypothetical protein
MDISHKSLLLDKVDGDIVDMAALPKGTYLLQDSSGKTQRRDWNPESYGLFLVWRGYAKAKWQLVGISDPSSEDYAEDVNLEDQKGQLKVFQHKISEGWIEKYEDKKAS